MHNLCVRAYNFVITCKMVMTYSIWFRFVFFFFRLKVKKKRLWSFRLGTTKLVDFPMIEMCKKITINRLKFHNIEIWFCFALFFLLFTRSKFKFQNSIYEFFDYVNRMQNEYCLFICCFVFKTIQLVRKFMRICSNEI